MTPDQELSLKHLELIHGVIDRLARNSFAIKNWCVVLVAAFLAFGVKEEKGCYVLVSLFPVVVFWGLDAYFLCKERAFRNLHDAVSASLRGEPATVEVLSMDTSKVTDRRCR